jgi:hypothetical protein
MYCHVLIVVTIDGYWIDNWIYWILSQLHSITTESLRTLSVSQLTTESQLQLGLLSEDFSARGLLARDRNLLPRTGSYK